ncbi:unnamed protein product [Rotaria magnacalcarata]|uniref:BTB domain-containing protein n=1 Tax=Rotaria magnacalcarata TaxID=392030 RepID=A0A816UJT8_9BILA|nr:unnamed protein product [Rotaria magnacalcarata]CAF3857140.1 unnamed protein product [Rotaria magnacalcarata]
MSLTLPNLPNGNDKSDSRQGIKQISSTEEQGAGKSSERYVIGDRNKSNWNDHPEYATPEYSKADGPNPKLDLLEHLSNDFAELLHRRDISDCCLKVQDTYMSVHRCILAARSNVFANVISTNMVRLKAGQGDQLEKSEKNGILVITVPNTDTETMKQVILFMYTARCNINEDNAIELLNAAGRFDIKSLKVFSGSFIAEHITLHNVLNLMKSAYDYDNKLVRQKCTAFFIDNAQEIMAMKETWKIFAVNRPDIIAELLYWNVNKEEFHRQKF